MPKSIKAKREKQTMDALIELYEMLRGERINRERVWPHLGPHVRHYYYTLERDELQYYVRTG